MDLKNTIRLIANIVYASLRHPGKAIEIDVSTGVVKTIDH